MFKYGPACLTSSRFTMSLDVLSQTERENDTAGEVRSVQDPDSLEWVRKWVPVDTSDEAGIQNYTIPCQVRSIIGSGTQAAGTQEVAGKVYKNIEFVRVFFPSNYLLSQNDRVTNIRDAKGNIIYLNEEQGLDEDFKPTIFRVEGVAPVPDFANVHVENYALLVKTDIQ